MISSERFKSPQADDASGEACPKCGGPLTWRQAHPHPVAAQIAFGVSFVAFLFFGDRLHEKKFILLAWCALQLGLGVWLARGRVRASKRVLRCIRCTAPLR